MSIKRQELPGRWIEKADDPKSAKELLEQHGPALQKHGAEKFHESFQKDLKEGFERVTAPGGQVTHMRRDRVEAALAQGYQLVATRTEGFVVPEMPWHKDHQPRYGRHVYKYDKDTGTVAEVT